MDMLMRFLLVVAFVYLAICLMMWFGQRSLMYPRHLPSAMNYLIDAPAPYRNFEAVSSDGVSLRGWHAPAKQGMPTIVYFHGNADHLGKTRDYMDTLQQAGFGVLLTSYRGYSGHKGSPTETGLYDDASAFIDALLKSGVDQKDLIIYGFSLGTGVATEMAVKYPPRALVLGAPFYTMAEAAGYRYGWLPVSLLIHDRYDNAAKIGTIDAPILIVNGKNDSIFPGSQGERLSRLARNITFKQFDGGHVDFFFDHGGKEFIHDWLAKDART